ncbi:MAG: hypothetical protein K2M42_10180 [Oscillospiraceae bacterium]|nr:hypothetical protein [Oscillospiraceae bacterium]
MVPASEVKVFVGSSKPLLEKQQQFNQIELLTDQSPDKTVEAVLTLNDYYTVESIGSLINSFGITINRVYMWLEGETGRLSLYVEDNDIKCSIENYIQQVESNGSYNDPAFAADYIRFLNGEYKVFALTVTTTAKTLADLSTETNMVSGIDVKYNADAEAYAAEQGSQVIYIELPAKPDGAQ